MYTRQAFEGQRAAVQAVERRETRVLAIVSVGLGLAQLLFIRWGDAHLDRSLALAIEGPAFLVYVAVVIGLLWRFDRRRKAARPACPSCGAIMDDGSVRVAAATGRCDRCGGLVIE